MSLPIAPYLPQIFEMISGNAITSVESFTGSGKTIAVPAYIASNGWRCFISVPTIASVRGAAQFARKIQYDNFIKQGMSQAEATRAAAKMVGSAAESEVQYSSESAIVYATTGHLSNKMFSYFRDGKARDMDFTETLMVDEIHVGSIDNTLILSLWALAATQGVLVPRLILASATSVPIPLPVAPVRFNMPPGGFGVQIRYFGRDFPLEKVESMYIEAARLAARIHLDNSLDEGHVIVFAPGKSEVEKLRTLTLAFVAEEGDPSTVLAMIASSGMKPEEMEAIVAPPPENTRKIIFGTNSIEASLTVPNTGFVIDTLLEKRRETSVSGGFRLALRFVAKDSAQQRSGRTGRTRPGVAYRMCTEEFYRKLDDHRLSEVERLPLHDTVIKLLDAGIDPAASLIGASPASIQDSIALLSELDMIETENTPGRRGLPKVTPLGRFAPRLPLGVRNAAFLWHWLRAGYIPYIGIVVAALLDCGGGYFFVPRVRSTDPPEAKREAKMSEILLRRFVGEDDLDSSLLMFEALSGEVPDLLEKRNLDAVRRWAGRNSMNNQKLKELLNIIRLVVRKISESRDGDRLEVRPISRSGIAGYALPILKRVYKDQVLEHRGKTEYVSPRGDVFRLDNNVMNRLAQTRPPYVLAAATAEITVGAGSSQKISFGIASYTDARGRKPPTGGPPRAIKKEEKPAAAKAGAKGTAAKAGVRGQSPKVAKAGAAAKSPKATKASPKPKSPARTEKGTNEIQKLNAEESLKVQKGLDLLKLLE